MREPKNQMLGTMEPPLMQLSVNHVIRPPSADQYKLANTSVPDFFVREQLKGLSGWHSETLLTKILFYTKTLIQLTLILLLKTPDKATLI